MKTIQKWSLLTLLLAFIVSCQVQDDREIVAEEDCLPDPIYTSAICKGSSTTISIELTGYCSSQDGTYTVYLKRGSSTIATLGTQYIDVPHTVATFTYNAPSSLTSATDYYYQLVRSGGGTITLPANVVVASCSTPGAVVTSPVGGYDDYFERDRVNARWYKGFYGYASSVNIYIKDGSGNTLKTYTYVTNDGLHSIRFPTIGGDKHNCYVEISSGSKTYKTGTFTIWDD